MIIYALLKQYVDNVVESIVDVDDVKAIIAESIESGAIGTAIENAVKDSLKVNIGE